MAGTVVSLLRSVWVVNQIAVGTTPFSFLRPVWFATSSMSRSLFALHPQSGQGKVSSSVAGGVAVVAVAEQPVHGGLAMVFVAADLWLPVQCKWASVEPNGSTEVAHNEAVVPVTAD